MIETRTDIDTGAGSMPTFIFHPEEDGPFPVVFYLMDAPSIRPALMDMASRLATAGYYVMMPYLYYRKSAFKVFGQSDEEMHERRELMQSVTRDGAMQDASALWQHAQKDPNANTAAKLGAVGFCMSGSLVLALAQQWRDRVGGVASIHGAWLVNDKQDSPHRRLQGISAEVYFGWADNDPTAPREDLATMREALQQAGVRHRIDFYEDAVHGYAPPGTERYNRAASEQHWERVHAMFRRTLR